MSNKMNNYAICVPVYKHRSDILLNMLKEVDDKFDIFVVTQINDPCVNEYNDFGFEVLVPEVTSIFQKREYIRNEMVDRGYKGFFMFDDDVKSFVKITEDTKRTTSNSYAPIKCNVNEVLDVVIKRADDYNCDFVSINFAAFIGFEKPNRIVINRHLSTAGAATYFRTAALNKFDIHYDVSGKVSEDIDIVIKLLQRGCNCTTVSDYAFRTVDGVYGTASHKKYSTLFRESEEFEKIYMNNTLKYNLGITINKNNVLHNVRKYDKYFNTFELPQIDKNILNFCKNEDILGLKMYLINKKNEKNSNRKGV